MEKNQFVLTNYYRVKGAEAIQKSMFQAENHNNEQAKKILEEEIKEF